jgi:hypothetical protein
MPPDDANVDGVVDVSDPIQTLRVLFAAGATTSCERALDANGDGVADVSDAVYALAHLFRGGLAPPQPFPTCGEVNENALSCDEFAACR